MTTGSGTEEGVPVSPRRTPVADRTTAGGRPTRDARRPPPPHTPPPPDGGRWVLALAVVGVVALAAAGLRQPPRDHVADREDRRVEPDLASAVPAGVRRVDHRTGDQDANEDGDEREELGRLERRLRLGAQRADGGARRHGATGVEIVRADAWGCVSAHEVLLDLELMDGPDAPRWTPHVAAPRTSPALLDHARRAGSTRAHPPYPRPR